MANIVGGSTGIFTKLNEFDNVFIIFQWKIRSQLCHLTIIRRRRKKYMSNVFFYEFRGHWTKGRKTKHHRFIDFTLFLHP